MPPQNISRETIVSILRNVEIFKNVPVPVIGELSTKMIISELPAEESIINQGDKGSSMYVVLFGEVKVHDKEFTIANLGAGSFFGEFSLLDDEPRSLSVSTVSPSVIGNIQQSDFYSILNKYPEITKDIIKVMLKRLRNQNQQIINQLRLKQIELEGLVKERTLDLQQKNEDLENTLNTLRKTQEQLVQQEKLASLGQITSGIAHEIQNPLNFINNFSSISKELADEITTAKNNEEQLEIISDLKTNLAKIEEHGKRADKIIKGMLMHSKSSKGEKQKTDISWLCEQALNLAYNSLGTNFKLDNCEIKKDFPENLPQPTILTQDISRVLINIINNAFYSVHQRKIKEGNNYVPSISISTKKQNGSVLISVRDNGTGIQASDKGKIFQPFFTTKPTGQGTGLGLSSGYEIVKAHGGEIKFESEENEFTEFVVRLQV